MPVRLMRRPDFLGGELAPEPGVEPGASSAKRVQVGSDTDPKMVSGVCWKETRMLAASDLRVRASVRATDSKGVRQSGVNHRFCQC
eukprot:2310966-Rhodomonas_salina.6